MHGTWVSPGEEGVAKEDRELVDAVRGGDSASYGVLYRAHAAAVRRVVAAMVGDPATTDDVVQEAFVRALEQLPNLREPDRFRAWLMAIARHAAVDALRARRRLERLGETDAEQLAQSGAGPDVVAELGELAQLVNRCTLGLSSRDAAAVFLVTQLGYSPTSLAPVLGVTHGAAKVIVHRARRRLRDAVLLEVLVRHPAEACEQLRQLVEVRDALGAAHHVRACVDCAAAGRREVELYDAGGPPTAV